MNIHTKPMVKKVLAPVLTVALFFAAGAATAFFDEIVALQEELAVWETANAADFSDVIEQLEDITGPVFKDVAEQDWFNAYVTSLAEWGIVSGYSDASGRPTGEYRPGNQVTVAEILKMSLEAAQINEDGCTNIPLHPQATGHWAKAYVACAEDMGIRVFNPTLPAELNRPATRAEVLTIVHDSFADDVLPLYSSFSDSQGHRFEADIAYANLYGIVSGDTVNGVETGTFRPDEAINRAETAKIIYQRLKIDVVAQAN